MKSFNAAINIIKTNVSIHQELCKNSNQKVLSNTEAFLLNLNPFGKRYGGTTGFQRGEKFITEMKGEIEKGNITTTEELIDFAAKYPDKGNKLSDFIWKGIREAAGFKEAHVNFLIPIYQNANASGMYDLDLPGEDESRAAIEKLFNQAICGNYEDELQKYLGSHLGLDTNQCADYGKKLLDHLNHKIPQVELVVLNTTNEFSLRNSH